ncbi:ATP-binding response regulator [Pedobacter boryungensis]|uniref:histidine kinase n=1 Tax=Pedobacter boryungensis TaxID=869962 RepID=A0ABX2DAI1_9SPHI|nr:histidine kinase [Pedobacter boryungensis]NQX31063.1 response regulator [Pedobacter boryungensis]
MINSTTSPYRILVVEDNLGDFTLIEEFIIERVDFPKIEHANSFKEAETLLAKPENIYHIILLDLSLPDKNGENLIHEIIALSRHTPVVVLTGFSDFEFGVKSLSMGVSDYLLKEDLNANGLYKSLIYSAERQKISNKLKESEKQVRSFANQLNNALEEERAHIAREIHDEFGQQLAGLKMSLSALRKLKNSPEAQEEFINSLVEEVNNSIEMVRRIANELRPVLIDKLGLPIALEWLVKEFAKKTGMSSEVNVVDTPLVLDKIVEINIFRICQEALTNIAKHAQATEIKLDIACIENTWHFKVSDNGIGIPNSLNNSISMGLLNMKERSYLIGATLIITNNLPSGTIIEITVNPND